MSNDPDNTLGNLVHTNLKQLPKRLKLAYQNEIHQVMFKYMIAAENIKNPLANQLSKKNLLFCT